MNEKTLPLWIIVLFGVILLFVLPSPLGAYALALALIVASIIYYKHKKGKQKKG